MTTSRRTTHISRLARAVLAGAIGAAIPTAIVAVVTLVTATSFTNVVTEPAFWLVEALTAALVAVGVYTEGAGHGTTRHTSKASRIARHVGWTAGGALLIGVVLAVATDTPTLDLLSSRPFLIAAGIAIAVAGLEASTERKLK